MKRAFQLGSLFAATLCLGLSSLTAQETKTRPNTDDTRASARRQAGQFDSKTQGSSIRVSQLMGMNIQNDKGENVGEINDIVLNAHSGQIQYAAVTYGGFLGVGNKMFAVPFDAFKVQQNPDDREGHILVLNVTQEQLDGAKGFDEDSWPNFADESFVQDLNNRYGVKRRAGRPTYADTPDNEYIERQNKKHGLDRQPDADDEAPDVDVDINSDRDPDNS